MIFEELGELWVKPYSLKCRTFKLHRWPLTPISPRALYHFLHEAVLCILCPHFSGEESEADRRHSLSFI